MASNMMRAWGACGREFKSSQPHFISSDYLHSIGSWDLQSNVPPAKVPADFAAGGNLPSPILFLNLI